MASMFSQLRLTMQMPGKIIERLIGINVIAFVLMVLPGVFFTLFNQDGYLKTVTELVSIPANLSQLATHPWTIFTYMFAHVGLFHILFNMLALYWFGSVLQDFLGSNKTLNTYLMGGIAGALFFVVAYNTFPYFAEAKYYAMANGASASVLAILVAAAVTSPNYAFNLILIGPVKIKWLVLVYILIDLISLTGPNAGGHFAHLGGAAWGALYVSQLRQGRNLGAPMDFLIRLFQKKPQSRLRVAHRKSDARPLAPQARNHSGSTKFANPQEAEVDAILDKIAKSGYDSLSDGEKQTLFKASAR